VPTRRHGVGALSLCPTCLSEPESDADRAFGERVRGELWARHDPGRVDDAGRRSRHAGVRLSQNRCRQEAQLPARIRRGRRGARPLLDHRSRARRGVARPRHARRNQPQCPQRARRLWALRRAAARGAARLHPGKPHRHAREPAADGGGSVRVSELRHGAADGGAAAAQSRPDRHSRRHPGAADRGDHLRFRARHLDPRHPGAAGRRRHRRTRARPRGRAAHRRGRRPRQAARQGAGARSRRRPRRARASRRRSRSPPSRSTGRCAGSIRRRSCSISTMATSPWRVRARKSWCAPAAIP
jgi:hypothetical protein